MIEQKKTIYVPENLIGNELYHYGMPRRSGRYKWGSGERPFQGLSQKMSERREKVRKKNIEVGTQRLQNRIKKANKAEDKYSRRIGRLNSEKAAQEHKRAKDLKETAKEILEDENRTAKVGAHTRHVRMAVTPLTVASTTAAASLGTLALASSAPIWIPISSFAGAAALGTKGALYLRQTGY